MGTGCVWTKKKSGFNSYIMHQIKVLINHLIRVLFYGWQISFSSVYRHHDWDWPSTFLGKFVSAWLWGWFYSQLKLIKLEPSNLWLDDKCNSGEFSKAFQVIYPNKLWTSWVTCYFPWSGFNYSWWYLLKQIAW